MDRSSIHDDHAERQRLNTEEPGGSRETSGSSTHSLTVAQEQQATNGGIGVDYSPEQAGDSGKACDSVGTKTMATDHFITEQDNAAMPPLLPNQTESINHCHTAAEVTESISDQEVDGASIHCQIVTTEPTSSGAVDQTASENARQENSNGLEVDLEMTVFRSSDVVDQNVNHESILNESIMPELTEDSPPSYESVVKGSRSTTAIQVSTEKASASDNNTDVIDVITTQPQSTFVNSPVVDVDNPNSNHDTVDSDPELTATIEYLRRRRRERGNIDNTEFCDNLGLCCTVCYLCAPTGNSSHEIQSHANCTRDCFEVS